MRTRLRAAAQRGAAARRHRRACRRGRPVARAAVRRTAGADLLGGRRQPAADQRRHLAADAAGRAAIRRSAFSPSEPGCRRNRRCRWTMPSTRCASPARAFCSISPPRTAAPSRRWAAPSAARPSCGFANSAACAANSPRSNLRYKALQEETEMLRDFAAAAPWPIWAKRADGELRLRQRRLCAGHRGRQRRRRDRPQPRTAGQRRPRRR